MNERQRAFAILERVEHEEAYASLLFDHSSGDPRSSAFIRTIVFGVLRWRNRIDSIIERLARRKAQSIDPAALQILRIGVCQLALMDVADHAAVGETVSLARQSASRAAGFVNAVLRTAARERATLWSDADLPLDLKVGHPEWLLERWFRNFGRAKGIAIAEANQTYSYPDLLINEQRISFREATAILEQKSVQFESSTLVEGVIRLRESTQAIREEIDEGFFHPIDEGSVAVGRIAASTTNGGPLLDVAAAPGGKAIVASQAGSPVVAADLSLGRLRTLSRLAERATTGRRMPVVAADGRQPPFRRRFRTVLLDAPCTATGTLRKSPEIKWRLNVQAIESHAELQRQLLDGSLDVAEEFCLYSTCSLEPEENDGVVAAVLNSRLEFELVDLTPFASAGIHPWIESGVLRLTPESGADGFTAHLLRRRSDRS